jgi:drug/metabolite transporter (DMT)-like permease
MTTTPPQTPPAAATAPALPQRKLTPTQGLIAAVVTISIWTAFIVVARAFAQRSLAPFDIAFLRFVGAAIVLVPWGIYLNRRYHLRGWLGVSPLSWRLSAGVGLFGSLGYALLAYAGFVYAPAAHASVLMPGSLPLWTALLSAAVLGVAITRSRALGLALIVAGDLMVGGASLARAFDGGDVWRGDLLFMCAASTWACYSVLARKYALDAVHATIAISVFAVLSFVPIYGALVLLHWIPSGLWTAPWTEIVFQMLMQGGGSVVISGISFTLMIGHFGPVRSTMLTALVPGLSAFAAVLFLGEPLGWNLLAGLALVSLGIVAGVRTSAAPSAAPKTVPQTAPKTT